jgi:hypothetical protein
MAAYFAKRRGGGDNTAGKLSGRKIKTVRGFTRTTRILVPKPF